MVRFTLRLFHFIAVAAAILLGPSIAAEEPTARHDLGESMPQVLYSEHSPPGFARWVSASSAITETGELDETLFHPQIRRKLAELLSQVPGNDGCLHQGPAFFDLVGAPDWGTPRKVLANSELVVQGTIVGKEYGFKGSIPGQLLKVRADRVFKGPTEYLEVYYVFFPVGEFQVGDVRICKTDSRYPPPPSVGDELLVSVPYRNDPDEQLLEPDLFSGQAFVTISAGKAHWSPDLRMDKEGESITSRATLTDLMDVVLKEGS